jgi:hypothetical protein
VAALTQQKDDATAAAAVAKCAAAANADAVRVKDAMLDDQVRCCSVVLCFVVSVFLFSFLHFALR